MNWAYHGARWLGGYRRQKFLRTISCRSQIGFDVHDVKLPFSIVILAGPKVIPECVACLRSFLKNAGIPKEVYIASDGSLDAPDFQQIIELSGIGKHNIRVEQYSPPSLPNFISPTTSTHIMMKKLALLKSLPIAGTRSLYMDSDILFYIGARSLALDLEAIGPRPAYMLDNKDSFDSRLILQPEERSSPVNGGFIWIPHALDWSRAIQRLRTLPFNFQSTHFTEQTCVHLAMHDSNGVPLNPESYVLRTDDQFFWHDSYTNNPRLVCRHFVSNVRHKMWMRPF